MTVLLASLTLAGCATEPAAQHRDHHPQSADAASSMPTKGINMDMCAMHEKMMNAKSPEERKALMAEHMRSMSPEMKKKHMEMMQEQMKMMQEHMGGSMPSK